MRHDGPVSRAGRRPAWQWAMAMVIATTAIIMVWAPAAQAEPADPLDRDMYGEEDPPGRYRAHAYMIFYHVNSPVETDCEGGESWLRGAVSVLSPIAGVTGAADAVCADPDFSFVGDLWWGLATEYAFAINRIVSTFGIWMIERAYAFDIAEWMAGPAEAIAARLETRFIDRIELGDFAVFLAVFYSGWQILRRRIRQALSELAASLMVAVIGGMLVANPSWLLDTALPYSVAMSGAMLELHSGVETGAAEVTPGDYDRVVRPLTDELHEAMIGQPYDLINWGELLTGECAHTRDSILQTLSNTLEEDETTHYPASGFVYSLSGDEARDRMRDAGCEWNAAFNAKSTDSRLAMAVVSVIVGLVVTLMLGLIAVVVIGSQLVLAQMLVISPLAVLFGTVPGTGRQLLARWAGVVLQALAAVVVMSFVLTLLLELTVSILGNESLNYSNRFFLLLIAVIMLFRARKKLLALVEEILERAAERLQVRMDGGAGGDLLSPGNMIRFGMGAAVGQTIAQQASGALVGRLFTRKSKGSGAGGPAVGGALPGGVVPGALPGGIPTPTPRRPSSVKRKLLQGARLIPGVGRAAGAAAVGAGRGTVRGAVGAGRGTLRAARRLPRGVGALPAMGYRGAVIGAAGVNAAAKIAKRAPRAAGYGTIAGTIAGAKAGWRGLGRGLGWAKNVPQRLDKWEANIQPRWDAPDRRALFAMGRGAKAAVHRTQDGAAWVRHEVAEGYWQAQGKPYSPTADKLLRYATQPEYAGKHRDPKAKHRAPYEGKHRGRFEGEHRAPNEGKRRAQEHRHRGDPDEYQPPYEGKHRGPYEGKRRRPQSPGGGSAT